MQESYKTKLVLFDLDGTLIDTAPDFLTSLNNILTKYNKENVTADEIRAYISEGSSKLIEFAFNINESHRSFEKFKNEFLSEYKNNLKTKSKLFDGIEKLLNHLDKNQIMYGIVTNKYFEYADPLVKSFTELKNIKIMVCPDHVSISKPDPEGILLACKRLNVSPEKTIYLGDHLNDLKAGILAGTTTIACLYGYSLQKDGKDLLNCDSVDRAQDIISKIS
tara:strand:- start:51 stop:713 length:663 start_codon:yes stop_codon:yes gene_type:complete